MGRYAERTLELHVAGEGYEVGCLESAVRGYVIIRQRAVRGEVGEVERGDDVKEDSVVCGVDVEALVERERLGVVVERRVGGGVMGRYGGMSETSEQLLDITDALRARDGASEA